MFHADFVLHAIQSCSLCSSSDSAQHRNMLDRTKHIHCILYQCFHANNLCFSNKSIDSDINFTMCLFCE